MARKHPDSHAPATLAASAGAATPTTTTDVEGSPADYGHWLPEARAYVGPVATFSGDPVLVYHNLQDGIRAVLAPGASARAHPTAEEQATIDQLGGMALALIYAASLVHPSYSNGTLRKKIARAHALRRILLTSAEACAEKGLVDKREVERIKHGKGPLDTVQDCIDLAVLLLNARAAVTGRIAATWEDVSEAQTLATELLGVVRPLAAPRPGTPADEKQHASDRDHLYALLASRHEASVWTVGARRFGKQVNLHVPALLSHRAYPQAAADPVAPAAAAAASPK
jgi:hypothetical protein